MKKRTHYYVGPGNGFAWLMSLCMVCSALTRIVLVCRQNSSGQMPHFWSMVVLPIAAAVLFVLIVMLDGKERYYKSAIPVWMVCLYYGLVINSFDISGMVTALFWIAIIFFALLYTQILAGSAGSAWMLLPLCGFPAGAICYLNHGLLLSGRLLANPLLLPDLLFLLGVVFSVCAAKIHPAGEYHPTWGDRPDGRRLRSIPPIDQVSPYIMVNRSGASNTFEQPIEISNIDRYIRQKRKEGMTNFGIMHVLLAAYVRGLCKYPALNRFLSGQKVYSRGRDIQYCMTVKKEMSVNSPDTVIKVHLTQTDTAADVYSKLNAAIEEVKNAPLDSSFDSVAQIFTMIPGLFLKFCVWLLRTLDYFGLVPKCLLEVSPFHGSLYLTSLGSLGIPPVYHHLYDFGNLPVFVAFGRKRRSVEVQEDGTIVTRKYVDAKFTLDERIVDGYYYAAFFRHYMHILNHPEILDHPPEAIAEDID